MATTVRLEGLALLPLLEHVSYVIECVIISATGEAKSELGRIVVELEEGKYRTISAMIPEAAERLKEAEGMFKQNQYSLAAGLLSRVSRNLWQQIF